VRLFSIVLTGVLVFFSIGAVAQPGSEKFSLSKDLTYIGFDVSYLLLFRATGRFNDFDGVFIIDHVHPEGSRADIIIKTTSVSTGDKLRDSDIRGPALFDAEKYPEMVFHSDKVQIGSDNKGFITGALTLRGVTRPVTMKIIRVPGVSAPENTREKSFSDGFLVTGEIKRSDFGMNNYIRPIGDIVTLYVCYKLEKCDSLYTQNRKTTYQYNN
jgi:polyisoprenoid-binding protein YceI